LWPTEKQGAKCGSVVTAVEHQGKKEVGIAVTTRDPESKKMTSAGGGRFPLAKKREENGSIPGAWGWGDPENTCMMIFQFQELKNSG